MGIRRMKSEQEIEQEVSFSNRVTQLSGRLESLEKRMDNFEQELAVLERTLWAAKTIRKEG